MAGRAGSGGLILEKTAAATIRMMPVKDIIPYDRNAKKHPDEQINALASMLLEFGFDQPIVVDRNNICVKGHGRRLAAMKAGIEMVPVIISDLPAAKIRASRIADNRIAQTDWDTEALISDLKILKEEDELLLAMTGFDDAELSELLRDHSPPGAGNEDAIPENVETRCKPGQLWILGEHRLLCGDSTNIQHVERLMGGGKADMIFTDPPYGIDLDVDYTKYGAGRQRHKPIHGDAEPFDPGYILSLGIDEIFIFGANYFADKLPHNNSWIVWDKRSSEENIGQLDGAFGSDVEICWSNKRHGMKICRILKQTAIFAARGEDKQLKHPTQKPIGLTEWFFEKWGKSHRTILDLYLGSGSTLIACEKTDRKCFGMEIDATYCDVILKRWEQYTGKEAKLG